MEGLISNKNLTELNNIRIAIEQSIDTKLTNAGIYFHTISRVKTDESIIHKLATGKYSNYDNGRKIQDIIGIRINLFYSEDIRICEQILEDTFKNDNWSKSEWEENKFEAQKCNGVFRIPSRYLRNITNDLWEYPFDQTFEVQLRTVLFEGWHEIEHEMRYKYKIDDPEHPNNLWDGQEKLARVMNSIIANLELCDWSIMQIFDNIARTQFQAGNWEYAIRSKYRLRITQDDLKPEIRTYFNENPDKVSEFFAVSKVQLVYILLNKKYHKKLTPDRVIYLINKEIVHDEYISGLLDKEQFVRVSNKDIRSEVHPLVSDYVYNQSIYIDGNGFERACEIIYDWVYQHMNPVFKQMPKEMCDVHYETIGYKVDITKKDKELYMDMQHISCDEPGVIWHSRATIHEDNVGLMLHGENICETMNSRERRYNRPKFMRDIYNQVGYIDCGRTLGENVKARMVSYPELYDLVEDKTRKLPIIVLVKPDIIPEWALDFDGYIIEADILKRTLSGIGHVLTCDEDCKIRLGEYFGADKVEGAVLYWTKDSNSPKIYSMDDINKSYFEETSHSVEDDIEYEKAFRYRLREAVSEEFVR